MSAPVDLSKREWFAGMALSGVIAADVDYFDGGKESSDEIAWSAVNVADALIAALADGQEVAPQVMRHPGEPEMAFMVAANDPTLKEGLAAWLGSVARTYPEAKTPMTAGIAKHPIFERERVTIRLLGDMSLYADPGEALVFSPQTYKFSVRKS